jgi:hypothetical protein
MVDDISIPEPFLVIPEAVIDQGLEFCPLKTRDEIEDEFNEWMIHIGLPGSVDEIIQKYLFFCRIKGEALNE